MRKAIVLGGGLVGSAMALELERTPDLSVSVADVSPAALDAVGARASGKIDKIVLDLSHASSVESLVEGFHVVLSALPSGLATPVLRAVIESNRLVADVGAPVEDAEKLHALAMEMEVAACVGCGVAGLARIAPSFRPASPLAPAAAARIAALMASALARRLLTGDFRGHWGVWTPERLAARVGIAHGLLADLRERGALPQGFM